MELKIVKCHLRPSQFVGAVVTGDVVGSGVGDVLGLLIVGGEVIISEVGLLVGVSEG